MLSIGVWYPATDAGGALRPDRVGAPFPLLVFSQGYDLSVSAYTSLLEAWASAGFVVAAPTYPHTDPSAPAALDESDIVNHPADLRFVITSLIDTARTSGSVVSGLVNSEEIGLVGHSDGGDVSLAVAENSCCRDTRVKAVAILSGAELATFGGTYFEVGSVPLLVVQGSADTINVPACSTQIYDEAQPPRFYLDLVGAEHEEPYIDLGTYRQVVERVTSKFFSATLAGQRSAATSMMSQGNVAGFAKITAAASAPDASGSCPGAP
jgi:predicted dienelactone hydrolase